MKMTMSCSVVVTVFLFVSVVVVINVGSATNLSQTHPSYVPVCPGDTVTFTCTTTTGAVAWALNVEMGASVDRIFNTDAAIGSSQSADSFTYTLVNRTGSNVESTATVTDVSYSLTGTGIYCSDDGMSYNDMVTLNVRNITSVGPPIGLSVTALNDSSVNLTWSPPSLDSVCITEYIISRDDGIPVVMTTTSTNTVVLSHGLSYGNTYNFTVAAVDKTNTAGSYSQHVIINLSVPNVVRNLHYTSSPGDGTITVYWDSPVNNYHPDIIRYIIRYTNMTDDTSCDVTSDVTNYTLRGVSGGSSYSISVSAVNIIGEGTNGTINVSLVDVSPTPSSLYTTDVSLSTIDSTSTSATSFTSTVGTSSSTSTPSTRPPPSSHATILSTIIPSTTNTTLTATETNTPSITPSAAVIGGATGGVFVIVVIILLLIICIPVIIVKKKKSNKDTPQQDHLMETFTSPTNSPPQEQPTALYAQVNRNTPPVTRGGGHHQRYNDTESTGQYSLISSSDDIDNPPPLPPPFNPMEASEYSVLRREDKEKQRIDDMRGANMGGPLYSTLNQERVEPGVIPAKPKGLVYAEVGNFTGRRANVPPPMEGTQSVIYSQVQQTPPIPKRTKTDQILAQIGDIEIPPPRPPKPSPRGPINNL